MYVYICVCVCGVYVCVREGDYLSAERIVLKREFGVLGAVGSTKESTIP